MRYWDASALVPLLVEEPGSDATREWLEQDATIVTWVWSRVEIASAVERRVRDNTLGRRQRREVLQRFTRLANAWDEIADVLAVRRLALALLARHPLTAADSAQLAAALFAAEDDASSLPFVCLDQRLAEAAERENMAVVTWPEEELEE